MQWRDRQCSGDTPLQIHDALCTDNARQNERLHHVAVLRFLKDIRAASSRTRF
jgi:hypothetical protein